KLEDGRQQCGPLILDMEAPATKPSPPPVPSQELTLTPSAPEPSSLAKTTPLPRRSCAPAWGNTPRAYTCGKCKATPCFRKTKIRAPPNRLCASCWSFNRITRAPIALCAVSFPGKAPTLLKERADEQRKPNDGDASRFPQHNRHVAELGAEC